MQHQTVCGDNFAELGGGSGSSSSSISNSSSVSNGSSSNLVVVVVAVVLPLVHVLQYAIDSRINSATGRRSSSPQCLL